MSWSEVENSYMALPYGWCSRHIEDFGGGFDASVLGAVSVTVVFFCGTVRGSSHVFLFLVFFVTCL